MTESVLALKNIYIKNKNYFLFSLKILIALGLLLFIIYTVNVQKIINAFNQADKFILFLASLLAILNVYFQYLKWKLVCNNLLNERDKKKIILSLFYGFSAGSFTPARIGEYFGRAILFSERPLIQITAATVIDKLFTLIVVIVIGSIFMLFYLKFPFLIIILAVILSGIIIALIMKKSSTISENRFFKKLLRFKLISSLYTKLSFMRNVDKSFSLKLFFLSILFYVCFIAQFALLVSAFSLHANFINYIWAGSLVMFVKSVIPPISLGELGIREGVSVYFVKQLGENAAVGFNASISLFLINILLPALIGLILLLKRK